MNNRFYSRYPVSERLELKDINTNKDKLRVLSPEEYDELREYLVKKRLLIMDSDGDILKEEK